MNIQRVKSAAIILPVLIFYIYFLPRFPFFLGLLIAAVVLAMREFYIMYKVPARLYVPGLIIGGTLFYMACRHPAYYQEGIFLGLFLMLFIRLIASESPSGSMADIGPLGLGFFYVAGFMSFQWFLAEEINGKKYILLLYVSVWLADSMAYYIGTTIGRNKLYPSVSPNKTFEGAFGSIMGGIAGVLIIKYAAGMQEFTALGAVVIGAVLGVATIIGDLIESMFKRDAGVKDSGRLIPGHGGILDKLDGSLVAGPVLYFILRFM